MKKYTIEKVNILMQDRPPYEVLRKVVLEGGDEMQVSDGYHTMDELYEHRIELFIALCKYHNALDGEFGIGKDQCWRSQKHSDGSGYDGWFILGIGKENGKQLSYHLPLSKWYEVSFAETLDRSPEWDGHTSKDVLERLKQL